jgi:very-short-patch-repair endonuclease
MRISRSVGWSIAREVERQYRRRSTFGRLQSEAASRPESRQIQTPFGPIWMSPIEAQFYEAMKQEGLDPVPQFYIQGYYADFAFPDIALIVEADGAVHNQVAQHEHDHKRDWILSRKGWTVKRFHGTTIYHRASNCAYVVRTEVEARRGRLALEAAERERRRKARRDALLRPFRMLQRLFRRPSPKDDALAGSGSEITPPRPPE